MNPNLLDNKPNISSIPNSFITNDEPKRLLINDFLDKNIKHPENFQISLENLVSIIHSGETRTFSEEIDKLESYGGLILNIL